MSFALLYLLDVRSLYGAGGSVWGSKNKPSLPILFPKQLKNKAQVSDGHQNISTLVKLDWQKHLEIAPMWAYLTGHTSNRSPFPIQGMEAAPETDQRYHLCRETWRKDTRAELSMLCSLFQTCRSDNSFPLLEVVGGGWGEGRRARHVTSVPFTPGNRGFHMETLGEGKKVFPHHNFSCQK